MSTDFSDLFAAAGADADRGALVPPEVLRRRGDVRSRRQILTVASVTVAVLAILAGAGLAIAHGPAAPMQPAGPTPVAITPTAPTQTTPVPPTAGPVLGSPSVTTPTPKSTACTGSELTFVSAQDDGGMGSVGHLFTVRNHGSSTCTLRGYPVVTYRASNGSTQVVPTSSSSGAFATVQLRPGGQAEFLIRHVNQYSGYPPGDPNCAHPVLYQHLAVSFPDGSDLPLGTDSLDVKCGVVILGAWGSPS